MGPILQLPLRPSYEMPRNFACDELKETAWQGA